MSQQHIYFFGEGRADGGRLHEGPARRQGRPAWPKWSRAGVPVPPGFTITTRICNEYYSNGMKVSEDFQREQDAAVERPRTGDGQEAGWARTTRCLVSVPFGRQVLHARMMDTILNLGLNDRSVRRPGPAHRHPRFAVDCTGRFVQMFGSVVFDMNKSEFEHLIGALKKKRRIQLRHRLLGRRPQDAGAQSRTGPEAPRGKFPQDPLDQLNRARNAVFRS